MGWNQSSLWKVFTFYECTHQLEVVERRWNVISISKHFNNTFKQLSLIHCHQYYLIHNVDAVGQHNWPILLSSDSLNSSIAELSELLLLIWLNSHRHCHRCLACDPSKKLNLCRTISMLLMSFTQETIDSINCREKPVTKSSVSVNSTRPLKAIIDPTWWSQLHNITSLHINAFSKGNCRKHNSDTSTFLAELCFYCLPFLQNGNNHVWSSVGSIPWSCTYAFGARDWKVQTIP